MNQENKIRDLASDKFDALKGLVDKRELMRTSPFLERPVSPMEFLNGKNFLNDTKGLIRPAIRHDFELIFSGEHYKPICNLFLDNEGIGSGKSTKIALFYSYLVYWLHLLQDPFGYFGLWDSQLAFMNMAPSGKTARDILFAKVVKMINRIEWFKERNYEPDPRIKSELKFYKNAVKTNNLSLAELEELEKAEDVVPFLTIVPGNSSENFPLGRDIYVAGVDEANFFKKLSVQSSQRSDPMTEIANGLSKRRESRFKDDGIVFCISSAGTFNTWMEGTMQRVEIIRRESGLKQDDVVDLDGLRVIAVRRHLWDADPVLAKEERFFYRAKIDTQEGKSLVYDLHIPVRYRREFQRNPQVVLRDIASIPTHALNPYITSWERFKNCFDDRKDPAPIGDADTEFRTWDLQRTLPPSFAGDPKVVYYAHIDGARGAGPGTDRCALCIAHRTSECVIIDLICSFKGSINDAITLSSVQDLLLWFKEERGFNFGKVTLDRWQSVFFIEVLNKKSIRAEQSSVKHTTMDNMRQMGYSGAFKCYYRSYLAWELQSLEDRGDGTKPDHGENGHNDESEALAKAIENAIEGETPLDLKKRERPRGMLGQSQG